MLAKKVQEIAKGVTSLCGLAGRTTDTPRGHRDMCGTLRHRLARPARRLTDAGRTALGRPGDLTDTSQESAEEFVTLCAARASVIESSKASDFVFAERIGFFLLHFFETIFSQQGFLATFLKGIRLFDHGIFQGVALAVVVLIVLGLGGFRLFE